MTNAQKIPMACDCANFVTCNLKLRKALFILLPQERRLVMTKHRGNSDFKNDFLRSFSTTHQKPGGKQSKHIKNGRTVFHPSLAPKS